MVQSQNIGENEIRRQIERIIQSRELESSPRLQEFLGYIVDEYLAGRAERIKGVTIAQAVFGATDSFDPESNSIVRVEAGRLRRRLNQYYLATGLADSVIVEVPKGGYVPAFRRRSADEKWKGGTQHDDHRFGKAPSRKTLWSIAAVVMIILVASWTGFIGHWASHSGPIESRQAQSSAVITDEISILAKQAWELMMPPEDSKRLEMSSELFSQVIARAPNRPLGYTGKSLALSIAVMFIKSNNPESDLAEASEFAQQAIDLDEDYALGWGALAMSRSLAGDNEAALHYAFRGAASIPQDSITPSTLGLVLITSGRPQDALELMLDSQDKLSLEPRTPLLNVLGQSYYLTGDYESAAKSFEKNLSVGGPWGPHLDLFLAATYQELGKEFRARAILEKIGQEAPDFPAREWLAWFIKPEERLEETMEKLRSLGLQAAHKDETAPKGGFQS